MPIKFQAPNTLKIQFTDDDGIIYRATVDIPKPYRDQDITAAARKAAFRAMKNRDEDDAPPMDPDDAMAGY